MPHENRVSSSYLFYSKISNIRVSKIRLGCQKMGGWDSGKNTNWCIRAHPKMTFSLIFKPLPFSDPLAPPPPQLIQINIFGFRNKGSPCQILFKCLAQIDNFYYSD